MTETELAKQCIYRTLIQQPTPRVPALSLTPACEILVEHIVDLFEKKDFKKKLISKLNSNVDIPIINEKTEKKILDKIYDVLVDALSDL